MYREPGTTRSPLKEFMIPERISMGEHWASCQINWCTKRKQLPENTAVSLAALYLGEDDPPYQTGENDPPMLVLDWELELVEREALDRYQIGDCLLTARCLCLEDFTPPKKPGVIWFSAEELQQRWLVLPRHDMLWETFPLTPELLADCKLPDRFSTALRPLLRDTACFLELSICFNEFCWVHTRSEPGVQGFALDPFVPATHAAFRKAEFHWRQDQLYGDALSPLIPIYFANGLCHGDRNAPTSDQAHALRNSPERLMSPVVLE